MGRPIAFVAKTILDDRLRDLDLQVHGLLVYQEEFKVVSLLAEHTRNLNDDFDSKHLIGKV
jgi:hypothetical protein